MFLSLFPDLVFFFKEIEEKPFYHRLTLIFPSVVLAHCISGLYYEANHPHTKMHDLRKSGPRCNLASVHGLIILLFLPASYYDASTALV